MGGALHGSFVVPDGSGGYRTLVMQRGSATKVSDTSITCTARTASSRPTPSPADTGVGADRQGVSGIAKGADVRRMGEKKGSGVTALHVADLAQLGHLFGPGGIGPGGCGWTAARTTTRPPPPRRAPPRAARTARDPLARLGRVTSAPSSGAVTRYRVMAYVTGVVLATSCLLGLSFWPWYVGEGAAGWLWTAHGYLYIVYVVTAFLLA
jgi:hypothetical protein